MSRFLPHAVCEFASAFPFLISVCFTRWLTRLTFGFLWLHVSLFCKWRNCSFPVLCGVGSIWGDRWKGLPRRFTPLQEYQIFSYYCQNVPFVWTRQPCPPTFRTLTTSDPEWLFPLLKAERFSVMGFQRQDPDEMTCEGVFQQRCFRVTPSVLWFHSTWDKREEKTSIIVSYLSCSV